MIQALVYAAQGETGGCAEAEGDCSAGVVSIVIPGYAERWDSIHWADRLSGLIIVRVVYIVESFLDLVETPAAAGISFESGN